MQPVAVATASPGERGTPGGNDARGFAPVRRRFVEALARRTAAHDGAARRLLDDRLARLGQASDDGPLVRRRADVDAGSGDGDSGDAEANVVDATATADTLGRIQNETPGRASLAALVARLAARAPHAPATSPHAPPAAHAHATPTGSAAAVEETLDYLRRTWSRLSMEQRLAQSRSTLPEKAGPLNSHHLVHRALTLMRELSPGYLERFMSHVDDLIWIEQAHEIDVGEPAPPPAGAPRRAARGRPG